MRVRSVVGFWAAVIVLALVIWVIWGRVVGDHLITVAGNEVVWRYL